MEPFNQIRFNNPIKAVYEPSALKSRITRENFFEGYYYKIINQEENLKMALIPGLSLPKMGPRQAFIQIIDGINCKSEMVYFPLDEVNFHPKGINLQIGENVFTDKKMVLNLKSPGFKIQGDIQFSQLNPWPVSLFAPGAMGPFAFLPFMECYHGVCSFDHDLSGQIRVKDTDYTMDKGKGYIEKDWGTSFPQSWIWAQSNHFRNQNKGLSIMISIAHIPWIGHSFPGHLIGLYIDQSYYLFTTYLFSRILRLDQDEQKISIHLRKGQYDLELELIQSQGASLISPVKGQMVGKLTESLDSRIHFSLFRKGKKIYAAQGENSGMEISGDISLLKPR